MSKISAVVAGATGLVGRELVRQLCAHDGYASVIALVRDSGSQAFQGLGEKLVVREIPSGDEFIAADEFYCTLGTTIKKAGSQEAFRAVDHDLVLDLAQRAKRGGVERVVVVTAIGSDANSRIFYSRVKGETERDLRALQLKHLEIYQPSLLLGDRSDFRIAERAAVLLSPLLSFALVSRLAKYAPIHASDLARKMIAGESL